MALVNDPGARPVRARPERGRLALGAALSLSLHLAGLAAAFAVSLRAEPQEEEMVIEVVWEQAAEAEPEPAVEPLALAEPELSRPELQPVAPLSPPPDEPPLLLAEAELPEPSLAEVEPLRFEPERIETLAAAPVPPPPAARPRPPAPSPSPAPEPLERREAPTLPEPAASPRHVAQALPVPAPAAAEARAAEQDDYMRVLLRWLEPHRRYPRAARVRGAEGIVRLGLTIDRAGSVVEARILEGSGEPSLDSAALDMARRAAPAPPLPAHWNVPRAVFVVPVRFALSG